MKLEAEMENNQSFNYLTVEPLKKEPLEPKKPFLKSLWQFLFSAVLMTLISLIIFLSLLFSSISNTEETKNMRANVIYKKTLSGVDKYSLKNGISQRNVNSFFSDLSKNKFSGQSFDELSLSIQAGDSWWDEKIESFYFYSMFQKYIGGKKIDEMDKRLFTESAKKIAMEIKTLEKMKKLSKSEEFQVLQHKKMFAYWSQYFLTDESIALFNKRNELLKLTDSEVTVPEMFDSDAKKKMKALNKELFDFYVENNLVESLRYSLDDDKNLIQKNYDNWLKKIELEKHKT